MAIKEFNVDLDVKGRVLASTVPNSTGSIVTWNTTTNVFGLRTNAQIISDLNLSSNFVPYTGATANVNLGTKSITSTGGFIGNASTATTLATSRTINGTSFNGSANITTANWGTARNITIGNTTKSVNGSANVSWSLAEIGASALSHTHPISDITGLQTELNKIGNLPSLTTTDKSNLVNAINEVNGNIPNVTGFIPYIGANQAIDFNTQNLNLGGYTNKAYSYFERINLASDNTAAAIGNFKLLTNVAAAEIGNASSQSYDIIITLPITTTTHWQAEIDILKQNYRATLNIGAYSTNNSARFVNGVSGNINDILEVKFGRIGDNTVIIIKRTNSTIHRLQVNIPKFYYHHSNSTNLYNDKTKYKVEYINESELVGFTLNGIITNAQFTRDSYYLDYNNFTNKPTIPTSSDFITTNTTQTGLSGDKTTSGIWTFNSQINTANHGNSSQWKQAYDWGDFRDYGLGLATLNSITDIDDANIPNGLYSVSPINTGLGYSGALQVERTGSINYVTQKIQLGNSNNVVRLFARHYRPDSSAWTPWREVITDENLDSQATSLGFIKTSSVPTVNDGQLTLSTGTGLSGSASFTANQSGNSSFSVVIASTHKLPTTAEWNALSTQTLSSSASNLIVSNTVQRAALTGDVTAAANSNATTIVNNAVTTAKIANSAVTHAKYQNIATQRILGRGATGTGNVQELTLGSNLSLSTGGVLNASYSAGTLALLNEGENTTNRVWGAKVIADYVKQYTGDNLGLQGVTDIGNWTTNAIDFIAGNDLMFTLNNGSDGSSHPDAPPTMGGTPSLQSRNKGFLFVNTSDTLTDYSHKLPYKFGMLDNTAAWANSFTFGSDFGYRFGYLSGLNGEWVSIELDTILHNTERLANATYTSSGGGYYNQRLHFPPENNATLATREWVLEGDSGTTPPTGNPTLGISFNLVYRTYRLRDNFTIDHVNKAIDAVDTKNTTGANASNSKMFLVGVLSQTTGENGNQSYSNSKIYATNGTLTATAFNGNASTATKLATARTIRTNLGSTTAVSFDGSGNITPGITGTLPIANGGTGTTSAGTGAQLTAGTTTTARVWSPKILADYVKEYVHEDKRVVNAIGSYGANNDHGATIILSTSTNGIGFGSASALRDTFEVSLYNNSNGSKDIWEGDGFTYQLQDGTTSSTIKIKARGIGTITRITKGSTAIMLALGDFEI